MFSLLCFCVFQVSLRRPCGQSFLCLVCRAVEVTSEGVSCSVPTFFPSSSTLSVYCCILCFQLMWWFSQTQHSRSLLCLELQTHRHTQMLSVSLQLCKQPEIFWYKSGLLLNWTEELSCFCFTAVKICKLCFCPRCLTKTFPLILSQWISWVLAPTFSLSQGQTSHLVFLSQRDFIPLTSWSKVYAAIFNLQKWFWFYSKCLLDNSSRNRRWINLSFL